MSTIDPSKITMVRFKGTILTGRILTVGKDGVYNYNYNHPQTAYDAANSGDIILIYPGNYTPLGTYTVLYLNRNISIYIRGMGLYADEVTFTTPTNVWHPICIESTAANINVVIENLKTFAGRMWSASIVHRQCSSSTVVTLNKLYMAATDYGYVVSFGEDSGTGVNYQGDCYITNCTIQKGYAHLRRVGAGSSLSTISVQKTQYVGGAYYCASCSRNPSPHDYVNTYATNYGHLYGQLFFDIIVDPIYKSSLLYKRNMWYKDPYIYKATASGVSIYNPDSQALIKRTMFPSGVNSVWSDEDHLYIATSISGVYRCSVTTISGIMTFEKYKSYPDITDNDVKYLHGCGDYLCAATVSGVDRYRLSDGARTYTIKDRVSKCFQTSNGDYYYVVNPLNNIIGLDDNLFGWSYGRTVTPSSTIPQDSYQFFFEVPLTQPDDIYIQSQREGADIRLLEDGGAIAPFHIDLWDYVSPPKIWATLSSGTKLFYLLYGNSKVQTKYNSDAYWMGSPTISGYTISRGQNTTDLFDAVKVHAVYNSGGEYIYDANHSNLLTSPFVSDIYVTENTSTYENGNVIFLATSWGATVIEEKRGDENNGAKRIYLLPPNEIHNEQAIDNPVFIAKSIIIDIIDNWGQGDYVGLRSVELFLAGSKVYTPLSLLTGYDTSASFDPKYAFMDEVSKTGGYSATNGWFSNYGSFYEQRVVCVFPDPLAFDSIVINNHHESGYNTARGARNISVYYSTSTITTAVYGSIAPNSVLIFSGQLRQHVASDVIDDQTLTLTIGG